MEEGRYIPGSGSIVSAVRTCSEVEPFVVGKPNSFLIHLILHDSGIDAAEALVIGDRMDTDIESGKRAGCPTILVLTGALDKAPPNQAWLQSVAGLASTTESP